MSNPIISVEHLSKEYRRGVANYSTFKETITEKLSKKFGREDPNSLVDVKYSEHSEIFLALDDVSFVLEKGDACGIIGRNGSGKSTLLKILSRITVPSSGRAVVNGKVASLLEVGTGFHPEMTGRENIYMNGAMLGMKKHEIDRLFHEIVDFSGVEKFIDTPVKRYSSGMYVRLAFSVASHLVSDIIILDEVLAVGDAAFQKKCLRKMEGIINDTGRTVIFVSHDINSVNRLCNKAVWLENGKVVSFDKTEEVAEDYGEAVANDIRKEDDEESACCYRKTWPGYEPVNSNIIVKSVYTCNGSGFPEDSLNIHDGFGIAIEFEARHSKCEAAFTVIARDLFGTVVFSSISNKEPNWYGKTLQNGRYRTICVIPGDFLNNGRYTVSINIFDYNFDDFISLNSILKLEVGDHRFLRGNFEGIYGGLTRPNLQWKTEKTGQAI